MKKDSPWRRDHRVGWQHETQVTFITNWNMWECMALSATPEEESVKKITNNYATFL
jgi:hypothetical protein